MDRLRAFIREEPQFTFHVSDTVGGAKTPDLTQRIDPDANMVIPLRSRNSGSPQNLDIYGRPGIGTWLVTEVDRVLRERRRKGRDPARVHLYINNAPRDGADENGADFYAAQVGEDLLAVTHLPNLRNVRERIKGQIYRVGGFDPWQQFRSSELESLEQPDSAIRLQHGGRTREDIPQPRSPFVANVDAFGNVRPLVEDRAEFFRELERESVPEGNRRLVGIRVGEVRKDVYLSLDGDLRQFHNGNLVLYPDRGRTDGDPREGAVGQPTIVWPWTKGSTHRERIEKSAFYQLSPDPLHPVERERRFLAEGEELMLR